MNRRKKQTLVALGVVALIGWARWDGRPDLTPAPTVHPTVSASTAATLQPPAPKVVAAPLPSKASPAPTMDPLESLARQVVAAWQAPTVQERQQRLAPLVTPDYLALAETIDPTQVPAGLVIQVTPYPTPDGSVVDVDLDDGTVLTLDVVPTDAGDLVSDIRPADA